MQVKERAFSCISLGEGGLLAVDEVFFRLKKKAKIISKAMVHLISHLRENPKRCSASFLVLSVTASPIAYAGEANFTPHD